MIPLRVYQKDAALFEYPLPLAALSFLTRSALSPLFLVQVSHVILVALQWLRQSHLEFIPMTKNSPIMSLQVDSSIVRHFHDGRQASFLANSSAISLSDMLLCSGTDIRYKGNCLPITFSDLRQFYTVFAQTQPPASILSLRKLRQSCTTGFYLE